MNLDLVYGTSQFRLHRFSLRFQLRKLSFFYYCVTVIAILFGMFRDIIFRYRICSQHVINTLKALRNKLATKNT